MLLSNAKDFLCHFGEIGMFQHQSAQRISEARVETGGDDDEIWREPSLDFMDGIGECLPVLASRRPRTQRNIQSKTFSFAASSLARRASPGIIGVLVSRKLENCRVVPEDLLRAIPVMDVAVDDQNSFNAVLRLRVPRADRGVVKQAKSHRSRSRVIMAART